MLRVVLCLALLSAASAAVCTNHNGTQAVEIGCECPATGDDLSSGSCNITSGQWCDNRFNDGVARDACVSVDSNPVCDSSKYVLRDGYIENKWRVNAGENYFGATVWKLYDGDQTEVADGVDVKEYYCIEGGDGNPGPPAAYNMDYHRRKVSRHGGSSCKPRFKDMTLEPISNRNAKCEELCNEYFQCSAYSFDPFAPADQCCILNYGTDPTKYGDNNDPEPVPGAPISGNQQQLKDFIFCSKKGRAGFGAAFAIVFFWSVPLLVVVLCSLRASSCCTRCGICAAYFPHNAELVNKQWADRRCCKCCELPFGVVPGILFGIYCLFMFIALCVNFWGWLFGGVISAIVAGLIWAISILGLSIFFCDFGSCGSAEHNNALPKDNAPYVAQNDEPYVAQNEPKGEHF